jgi:hypothetical protein
MGGPSLGFCQGKLYVCGDLVDNDADGLVDAADPDCLGACDNTESNHGIEIPDGEQLCVSDCYWDSDGGAGNDECRWSHRCDSLSPSGSKCPYDPSKPIPGTVLTCAELTTMQSPVCADFCAPLTPNGCDAFGCCEFPPGSQQFMYLGTEGGGNFVHTCSSATLGDPSQCHPCTPVPATLNPCDACELCLGKTQLEAGCNVQACPAGAAACGLPGQAPCAAGEYCVTGCCRPTLN